MVPRIVIDHGSIRHSLCPFCGGVYKDFTKKCFVASAVYGSASAPEVVVLRRFRDNTLRRFWLGRMFIKAYYRFSPPVANFLAKRPRIASRVRALLDVLVRHCD
nr:CFI-box-CTERM domain-containing protein [Xylophilus sp. ASV27]